MASLPLVATVALFAATAASAAVFTPPRSADDLSNPHKGFLLWGTTFAQDGGVDNFHGAHLYHVYVPWREVESADQVFDWTLFESRHIDPIVAADPAATFVLRLVADYPDGSASGIDHYYTGGSNTRDYPLFLEQPPWSIAGVNYASCDGDGPGRAPDWNDPDFATQAAQLVAALADRYDGDARISAIQVGLLGLWGEWHQSGCEALAPGDAVKLAVRDAYVQQFAQTPLQTRYARSIDVGDSGFGFHEDYFPSFTASCSRYAPPLPLCDDSGDWNLEYALTHQSPQARDNWRVNPISGESPLPAQQDVWVTRQAVIEDLIAAYHLSFLGPAGKHEQAGNGAAMAALKRRLGYQLHLDRVEVPDPWPVGSAMPIALTLANSGSAPLYHDYRLRLELLDGGSTVVATCALADDLRTLLPGPSAVLNASCTLPAALAPGSYALRAAVIATAPARPPLLLQSSPRDPQGRVQLGAVTLTTSSTLFADGFE
ncbi:MAG: DUF4832 domain-containing protein [Xanthomonadales bacterium]|nr:DUF4832 domain-containing protein [Xanthomonadales bacterium]MCC6561996.1 DUF4832 domain-containing protein [Xanthomonadales bacterium]